jgi:hypothetical protein
MRFKQIVTLSAILFSCALAAILLLSYTPVVPILFHFAGLAFVAIYPPEPLPAPRNLYARVVGVPVHGFGDDSRLFPRHPKA